MFHKDKITYEPVPLPHRANMSDAEMHEAAAGFLNQMRTRHTVREYSDRSVDQAVIADCIASAGTAPSGANHQPWHFVAISNPEMKAQIRLAAEKEEENFYDGGAGDEWLRALEPIGTGADKPHLEQGKRMKLVNHYAPFDIVLN